MHYIAADMTTAAGCATVAQGVLDRLGGIDILVDVKSLMFNELDSCGWVSGTESATGWSRLPESVLL